MPYAQALALVAVQAENMEAMVAGVNSDNPQLHLEAVTQFRKVLSIGTRANVLG